MSQEDNTFNLYDDQSSSNDVQLDFFFENDKFYIDVNGLLKKSKYFSKKSKKSSHLDKKDQIKNLKLIIQDHLKQINSILNIDAKNYKIFLSIISGKTHNISNSNIFDLYKLSKTFKIEDLLNFLEKFCQKVENIQDIITILKKGNLIFNISNKELGLFYKFIRFGGFGKKLSHDPLKLFKNNFFIDYFPSSAFTEILLNCESQDSIPQHFLYDMILNNLEDRLQLLPFLDIYKFEKEEQKILLKELGSIEKKLTNSKNTEEEDFQNNPTNQNHSLITSEQDQTEDYHYDLIDNQDLLGSNNDISLDIDSSKSDLQGSINKKDNADDNTKPKALAEITKPNCNITTNSTNESVTITQEREQNNLNNSDFLKKEIDFDYGENTDDDDDNKKNKNINDKKDTNKDTNNLETKNYSNKHNGDITTTDDDDNYNKKSKNTNNKKGTNILETKKYENNDDDIHNNNDDDETLPKKFDDSLSKSNSLPSSNSQFNSKSTCLRRFNPDEHTYDRYSSRGSYRPPTSSINKKRIEIFNDNRRIVKNGYYHVNRQKRYIKDDYDSSLRGTEIITDTDPLLFKKEKASVEPIYDRIQVTTDSTFSAAIKAKRISRKTCVLNFASSTQPGGGVLNGRNAQEEALSRQSTLYFSLFQATGFYEYNKRNYNSFGTDYMIYSPNVIILRDDYDELIEPVKVSVISAVAVNYSELVEYFECRDIDEDVYKIMKNRCCRIIRLCLMKGNDVLVLGAFGCGVFQNDPKVVSRIFKEVLIDEGYGEYFKKIIFAIKIKPNQSTELVDTFAQAFKNPKKSYSRNNH